jgi:peroxiredoxin family protein
MDGQGGKTAATEDLIWEKRVEELVERKVAERFDRLQASIEQVLEQRRVAPAAALSDRATVVVFSGEMDRLLAAFVIGTGAAAMGMEVSMYFTFWGLTALKKTTSFAGKSVPEKLIAAMLPSGPDRVGTSKLNMLGFGPAFFKMMMRKHNVETLPDLIVLAQEMGVRLIACQMSMGVMGIRKEELLDGLDYGGVGTYLGDACDSKITLFI